ncbi:hypothetical protein TMU01_10800 [Tenuibacillus multivorans]|nr:hypothetical protein TMU01_10800 [Tenuibacillus multivorans]
MGTQSRLLGIREVYWVINHGYRALRITYRAKNRYYWGIIGNHWGLNTNRWGFIVIIGEIARSRGTHHARFDQLHF